MCLLIYRLMCGGSPRGFFHRLDALHGDSDFRLAPQFPRIPTVCHGHPVQSIANVCLLKQAWTDKPCQCLAERRGFEPRKPFWSLHAFQACLFNHSSISPRVRQQVCNCPYRSAKWTGNLCLRSPHKYKICGDPLLGDFANRLQNYCFFMTYARVRSLFLKKISVLAQKSALRSYLFSQLSSL